MQSKTHLRWALGAALAGAAALMVPGCYINVDEGSGDDWEGWDDGDDIPSPIIEERAEASCEPYCLKLLECGTISHGSYRACIDVCIDRYVENEDDISAGCECVASDTCGTDSIVHCPGQPIPDVWYGGDDSLDPDNGAGGQSSGSGGNSGTGGNNAGTGGNGGTDPEGPSCSTNHDCSIGADCVENICLDRCVASCQCSDGQACVEGYCQTPEEPAASCLTDCDCTKGMSCVEGFCTD